MRLKPGHIVDRYVVQGQLGQGGMATVYSVKHTVLGTHHALKVLNQSTSEVAARLIQEGQLQARLDPRVIVPVTDVLTVDGAPALLMPLIRGCSLRELLETYRPTTEDSLFLVRAIALSLHNAHTHQITHRDLKPGNILLEIRYGQLHVRVSDFGIARTVESSNTTNNGQLLGTVAYVAPEQLDDPTTVGPRADLWSLGVIAYEMLTSIKPFSHDRPGVPILRMMRGQYDRSGIPSQWLPLIEGLLEPEPDSRIASALEVVNQINESNLSPPNIDSNLARAVHSARTAHSLNASPTIAPVTEHSQVASQIQAAPASADSVPVSTRSFVGRDDTLEALRTKLLDHPPLLTILGPGGVGKTTTIIEYAKRHSGDWDGGVYFTDLSDAHTAEGVHGAFARTLGIRLGDGSEVRALRRSVASRGRALFILDNVEQVVEPIRALLNDLLEGCPEATFIATSRTVLRLRAERTWPLHAMSAADAQDLFIQRARDAAGHFTPTEKDLAQIDALSTALDHLPLAIELAASRIRMMSPSKMLAHIGERFRLLTSSDSVHARHRTLRATIDWSWDLLKPHERSALAQMSVFEGGFDIEATEAVVDLSEHVDAPWVVDVVRSLIDHSLIKSNADDHFTLYESVRVYAKAQSTRMGLCDSTKQRHASYFAEFGARDVLKALKHHGGLELFDTMRRHLDNFFVATESARAIGDSNLTIHAALPALYVLWVDGPLTSAQRLGDSLLMLPEVAPAERVRLILITRLISSKAIEKEAATLLNEALTLSRELGDRDLESMTLIEHAQHAIQRGAYQDALQYLQDAGSICEETGNRAYLATSLGLRGSVFSALGHVRLAQDFSRKAITLHREVGNVRAEGSNLTNLGRILRDAGHLEEARDYFLQAIATHHRAGNPRSEGIALFNLGNLQYILGDYGPSEVNLNASVEVTRQAFPRMQGVASGTLAKLYARRGEYQRALDTITKGEPILRDAKWQVEIAKLLAKKATVLALTGDLVAAETALQEAELIGQQIGGQAPDLRRELAESHEVMHQPQAPPHS